MTHDPELDDGPFDVELVLAIWPRVSRALDALRKLALVPVDVDRMHEALVHMHAAGRVKVDDPQLAIALRLLALQEGMHAVDWLRMRAVEAAMPRRKQPPALDLQLRLKGINTRTLVAKVVERTGPDGEPVKRARVTIRSARGDVASSEAAEFGEALEAAIQMAGARRDPGGTR